MWAANHLLFMPTVAFNICCPRDCVSRHNGGPTGAPLKPPRDDSALRTLSSLRGLRGPIFASQKSIGPNPTFLQHAILSLVYKKTNIRSLPVKELF